MLYSASIQAREASHVDPCFSVWVSGISLTGFRNYDQLSLAFNGQPVVLAGANGAGKTNLMEAISLLAPGRGLRRAKTARLKRQSPLSGPPEGWSISARIETPDGPFQAGTGIRADDDAENPRRVIRLDGVDQSQMALAERLAVSWLTPEMDGVLAGSPSERRRFLDRLVIAFDPAHAGRLQRYDKAARQRNRLIDDKITDDHWFEALETEMASSAVAIIAARKALVAALDQEAAEPLPAFPSARLRLDGDAEAWLDAMPAVDVEDRLRDEARMARRRGDRSLPGASASLLRVTHSGTGQEAELSSTGEQKALVISVILAHARLQGQRLGKPPLLLLDDIASHLDRHRREALFELAAGLEGQVWFSGTDLGLFAPMLGQAQVISLSSGRVVDAPEDKEFSR
ncbi:MAG: DNA replication/repair protein RecF [Candidatus Puniceispirillales bacterium]